MGDLQSLLRIPAGALLPNRGSDLLFQQSNEQFLVFMHVWARTDVKEVIGDCKGSMEEEERGSGLGAVGVDAGRRWLSVSACLARLRTFDRRQQ